MTRAYDRRHARSIASSTAHAVPAGGWNTSALLAAGSLLLIGLVVAVFGQTAWFGVLNFDDDQYLDAVILQGLTWQGFVRAWTEGHVGNWHPLTTLSFMIDAQLFGVWWGGYHLHNVVLHAAASAVLFVALTRLTRAMGSSFIAAALFAVHPLRAESVAWITERKDVVSGLFLATTLLAYAWYVEKPTSRRRYALVLASFVAGLLSKSMLVTMPVALLILDWWPLRRIDLDKGSDAVWGQLRPLCIEKVPLLAIAIVSAIVTVYSIGDPVRPIETLPFGVRASSSVVAYASYVLQLFWPIGLAPHYPYSSIGPTAMQVAVSTVFVASLTSAAWMARNRWPSLTTGWAWFLVTLLPVIGFVTGGIQLIADRYTYVSQIWLVVAVVSGLADVARRLGIPRVVVSGAAILLVVAVAWGGWAQTTVWRDNQTLWRYTLSVTEPNAYAHANLGAALVAEGEPVEAAEQSRKALALESDNIIALSNLAILLVDRGGTAEAIRLFERALEVNPKFAFGWSLFGNALRKGGRIKDAEQAWRKAVALNPKEESAWTNLATLALERKNPDEAVVAAEHAVAAGGYQAALVLGQALDAVGRPGEAVDAYQKAVRAAPASTVALNQLGLALERTGRLEESANVFRRAMTLEPAAPILEYHLGCVLAKQGLRQEALAAWKRARERFRAAGDEAMATAAAERIAEATAAAGRIDDVHNR